MRGEVAIKAARRKRCRTKKAHINRSDRVACGRVMEQIRNRDEYPSSDVFLTLAMDEYTKERERANKLEGKATFYITLIVLTATIFVPVAPLGKIRSFYCKWNISCVDKCIVNTFLVLAIIAFILLFISLYYLVKAYNPIEIDRPNLSSLDDDKRYEMASDEVKKELSMHYKEVVDENVKVNDEKCCNIDNGIHLCSIGLLLLVISVIGLLIVIGDC